MCCVRSICCAMPPYVTSPRARARARGRHGDPPHFQRTTASHLATAVHALRGASSQTLANVVLQREWNGGAMMTEIGARCCTDALRPIRARVYGLILADCDDAATDRGLAQHAPDGAE